MILKLSKNVVNTFIVLIGFIIMILNFIYIPDISAETEYVEFNKLNILNILLLIIILISILLIVNFSKKIMDFMKNKRRIFIVLMLAVYMLISVLWIYNTQAEPVDDQKTVHDLATYIHNNEWNKLQQDNYLTKNPQQIGIAYFVSFIYDIFNTNDYRIIQLLNVLCNILSIIGLYLILNKIKIQNNRSSAIYFIIALTFFPLVLLSTFVYGDYVGMVASVFSVYFLINYNRNNRQYMYIIFSAILMAIAYIAKMNYFIFFIAAMIYLLISFIKKICDNKKDRKNIITYFIFIIFFAIISIVPCEILKNIASNKFNYDKEKSIPTSLYFYMGMIEGPRANGWYNPIAYIAWEDIDKARTEYPRKIKERLEYMIENPLYTAKFYLKKTASMWSETTFQSIWYNMPFQLDNNEFIENANSNVFYRSLYFGKLNVFLKLYSKAMVILVFTGVVAYAIYNRKKINLDSMFILIIFIGGFFFQNIWEAKSRYVLPYFIILIPVAVIGINQLMSKFKKINLIKNSEK